MAKSDWTGGWDYDVASNQMSRSSGGGGTVKSEMENYIKKCNAKVATNALNEYRKNVRKDTEALHDSSKSSSTLNEVTFNLLFYWKMLEFGTRRGIKPDHVLENALSKTIKEVYDVDYIGNEILNIMSKTLDNFDKTSREKWAK